MNKEAVSEALSPLHIDAEIVSKSRRMKIDLAGDWCAHFRHIRLGFFEFGCVFGQSLLSVLFV